MFTRKDFDLASAKVFQAGLVVDNAIISGADAKAAWATLAIRGIQANKLTVADIELQLKRDYMLQRLSGKEQAEFVPEEANIGDCGSTIKGWFYDLKRVIASGNEPMQRVANGEGLTTVRRACKPVQPSKKSKPAAPKAKATMPSLNAAIAAIRHNVALAKADNNLAMELASNPELSAMIEDITALDNQVMTIVNEQGAQAA